MKYIDEFRDGEAAQRLADGIRGAVRPEQRYQLMEFCGGHTHAIHRYGIQDLLPEAIRMIHGPGCPVCVLPIGRLDMALGLAAKPEVILCSYGDMLRVPGSGGRSLIRARGQGCDVRMVYSASDALELARRHPDRQVVFFAIGFETTTPPTAVAVKRAAAEGLGNFSVLCNHVLTPAAITYLLDSPEARELGSVPIDGFLGPAHVSVVIGSKPYEPFAAQYRKPVVYTRAVTRLGNQKAQKLVAEIFETRSEFEWRGLGIVPDSALAVRGEFGDFDAERRFGLEYAAVPDNQACECGAILRGVLQPTDCKLFGRACTPETPMGSCMVSSEGACAAYHHYGRFRGAGSGSQA